MHRRHIFPSQWDLLTEDSRSEKTVEKEIQKIRKSVQKRDDQADEMYERETEQKRSNGPATQH